MSFCNILFLPIHSSLTYKRHMTDTPSLKVSAINLQACQITLLDSIRSVLRTQSSFYNEVLSQKYLGTKKFLWHGGVVVTTTAQLHSTNPELRFYTISNSARGMLGIRGGEDLWQWSRLEQSPNTFRRSTIPRKQLMIIIIIIIIIIN